LRMEIGLINQLVNVKTPDQRADQEYFHLFGNGWFILLWHFQPPVYLCNTDRHQRNRHDDKRVLFRLSDK